jgi:hypothetical protein
MLYLIFVRVAGWIVLLARLDASKDAEVPVAAAFFLPRVVGSSSSSGQTGSVA